MILFYQIIYGLHHLWIVLDHLWITLDQIWISLRHTWVTSLENNPHKSPRYLIFWLRHTLRKAGIHPKNFSVFRFHFSN